MKLPQEGRGGIIYIYIYIEFVSAPRVDEAAILVRVGLSEIE